MNHKKLGEGAYGIVKKKDGIAVKTFKYLLPLVQEYAALRYLRDCNYIVKVVNIDFPNLELSMELYDSSLRGFIHRRQKKDDYNHDVNILVNHIIKGLIELHDRGLLHGDIKPSNILINYNPLRAVLGDCGFVSNTEFSKITHTASRYREKDISYDYGHDMFSLGVTFFEIFVNLGIDDQISYKDHELNAIEYIKDPKWLKIILNLTQRDRTKRFTARELLDHMYQEKYKKYVKTKPNCVDPFKINSDYYKSTNVKHIEYEGENIKHLFKTTADKYGLKGAKKGYWAMITYVERTILPEYLHTIYVGATLMILSSVFGKFNYGLNLAMYMCEDCKEKDIYIALKNMINDDDYLKIIFY